MSGIFKAEQQKSGSLDFTVSPEAGGFRLKLSGGVFGVEGLFSRAEFRNLIAFLERELEQRTNEESLGREGGQHPAEVFNAARSVKSIL